MWHQTKRRPAARGRYRVLGRSLPDPRQTALNLNTSRVANGLTITAKVRNKLHAAECNALRCKCYARSQRPKLSFNLILATAQL